jgi:hypothetical protein
MLHGKSLRKNETPISSPKNNPHFEINSFRSLTTLDQIGRPQMFRLKTVAITGFLLLGVVLIAGPALSQTSAANAKGEVIDLTPIVVALINLIFPAVAGVATYVINRLVKNQQLATQLSNAVENAVGYVQQHAAETLRGKTELRMTINDSPIKAGVKYVTDNAAEAITHFKIPTERIAEKLIAKIGLAAVETNRAATESTVPGVYSPLAPVPAIHRPPEVSVV